jgi:3D (Asp-Asp-Asp) domain-containing protein/peptidoglycan hydrolase CwlO-like protein
VPGRIRSRTAQLAGLALGVALLGASSALASQTAQRTSAGSSLGSREHAALLELYALDSQLHAANARVAYLAGEAATLQRERKSLRFELGAARSTLAVAQHQLGVQLRALYERGDVDALAVVFGATSLSKGLHHLDYLTRIADQSRQVLARTREARQRLLQARRTFASDARRLARSLASAQAAQQSLAATVAGRTAYIASLRARAGGLKTSSLVSSAGAAQKKSQKISGGHTSAPPPRGGRKMVVSATCYILKGTTASGLPVGPGIVAVDPRVIPLGTKLYIPGYGKGVAADVGGGIKGAIIDLWYATYKECAKWGRRTVTITIY